MLLVDRGFLFLQREQRRDEVAEGAVREAVVSAEELGDADLLSAALDLAQTWEVDWGRYGDAHRISMRRLELVPRMTSTKEIGDTYAMAAWTAQHLGRYREAEAHAAAGIDHSRDADASSHLHGLVWRSLARFKLGEWDDALADHAELERLAAQDPRERPAGFTVRSYAFAGLCHELRGESAEADRYLELVLAYFDEWGVTRRRALAASPVALTLALRERLDEALDLLPPEPHGPGAGAALEALCEIVAAQGRWEDAAEVVAIAREETEAGELLSLPPAADRLQGRAAAAAGDVAGAADLLERSAEAFAALEASWDEAVSRLHLAEAVVGTDRQRAEREARAALAVFERLGSVREAERARALLATPAV
jgi:tetratricopeptide (TPR) repeat protein